MISMTRNFHTPFIHFQLFLISHVSIIMTQYVIESLHIVQADSFIVDLQEVDGFIELGAHYFIDFMTKCVLNFIKLDH